MIPYIVSHTRTGTHLLAELLYTNLMTGVDDYENLHYSHSRRYEGPYIHLHRPLLPTMVSVWKVREHLGIRGDVSFSVMIRLSWERIPRATSCEVLFNGERLDKVCSPRDFDGTLLDRWLRLTDHFQVASALSFSYSEVCDDPRHVVDTVRRIFGLESRGPFLPVVTRKGWISAKKEEPTITLEDYLLMGEYQCRSSVS